MLDQPSGSRRNVLGQCFKSRGHVIAAIDGLADIVQERGQFCSRGEALTDPNDGSAAYVPLRL